MKTGIWFNGFRWASAAAVALALSACASPSASSSPTGPVVSAPGGGTGGATSPPAVGTSPTAANASSPAPKRGGTLSISCADNGIQTLDPAFASGLCALTGVRTVFDSLLQLDASGNSVPSVASAWVVSPDGLTYTFTLRNDVQFHDGSTVDGAAVKSSIERMLDTKVTASPAAALRQQLASVDVPNASTVVVTMKAPNASFLYEASIISYMPIVNPTVAGQFPDVSTHDAGSGPFIMQSFQPGGAAAFVKNPHYWQKAADGQALPYLDGVKIEPIIDASVRFLNVQSGTIDYAQQINTADVPTAKSNQSIQIVDNHVDVYEVLGLNPNMKPFDNQLVRQAVVEALDRESIVKTVSLGSGFLRPMGFRRDTWFDLTGPTLPYDLADAKKKLADAGYVGGFEMKLVTVSRTPDLQILQIMQEQLNAVGIKLTIDALDRATNLALIGQHQTPMLLTRISSQADPNVPFPYFLGATTTSNWVGWNDATSDKLIDLGQQALATTDQAKRRAIYQDAANIWVDAAVYTTLGNYPAPDVSTSTVHDVRTEDIGQPTLTFAWKA